MVGIQDQTARRGLQEEVRLYNSTSVGKARRVGDAPYRENRMQDVTIDVYS